MQPLPYNSLSAYADLSAKTPLLSHPAPSQATINMAPPSTTNKRQRRKHFKDSARIPGPSHTVGGSSPVHGETMFSEAKDMETHSLIEGKE